MDDGRERERERNRIFLYHFIFYFLSGFNQKQERDRTLRTEQKEMCRSSKCIRSIHTDTCKTWPSLVFFYSPFLGRINGNCRRRFTELNTHRISFIYMYKMRGDNWFRARNKIEPNKMEKEWRCLRNETKRNEMSRRKVIIIIIIMIAYAHIWFKQNITIMFHHIMVKGGQHFGVYRNRTATFTSRGEASSPTNTHTHTIKRILTLNVEWTRNLGDKLVAVTWIQIYSRIM